MSTPEQMWFATTHKGSLMNFPVLNAQLFASLGELARLNMDACRQVLSGARLHWENVLLAQTPEQVIRCQADTLPWLAVQLAGYTRGCMDIASGATANLSRNASDQHDAHARHLGTTLDGMARCARGVDAMLRAFNPAPVKKKGVKVAQPLADSQDLARAVLDRASGATAGAGQRSRSPAHRQSSR